MHHDIDTADQTDVGVIVIGEEIACMLERGGSSRQNLALWALGEEFNELGILLLIDGQVGECVLVERSGREKSKVNFQIKVK